jgi:hypothetical protein
MFITYKLDLEYPDYKKPIPTLKVWYEQIIAMQNKTKQGS